MCDEQILLNNISQCGECVGINGEDPEMCMRCSRHNATLKTNAEAYKAYIEAEQGIAHEENLEYA